MKFSSLALAAFTALSATAVHADTLVIDYDYLGPSFDYTAMLTTPSQNITASPYLVDNLTTVSTFVAFDLEPFVPLSPSTFAVPGNSTYSSATPYNIAAVKALYNGYYTNAFAPIEAAAFQFALWELVTETSLPPNMTNGSFAFANGADPAVARATVMLSGAGAASNNYNLFAYTTSNVGGDRSANILTATPVPEVGTYAMMIAGLAMVGAAATRRRNVA